MTDPKKVSALFAGSHNPNSKMCIMEAVAYVAGEKWSDHPECVSPVIAGFLRRWNDDIPDDATRTRLLTPLIPLVLGTHGSEASEITRSWMAFDWLIRTCTPAWMDLTEALKPHALALRTLGPIFDQATLDAAMPTLEVARKASAAARAAAWVAAWAAARAAAWVAAWAAAWDAAWDAAWVAAWAAAWDAARDAAWAAARDAAWVAARDAVNPTVVSLQESAQDLVRRMADVERVKFTIQRSLRIGEVVLGS